MHTRSILLVLILGLGATVALLWATTRPETPTINFTDQGVIIQHGQSQSTDSLLFVYEEPGEPALTARLVFTDASRCVFGQEEIQCVALSTPLFTIVQNKRVFIEGSKTGDIVTVQTLALDIEADRTFGIIRSVNQNGVNALVEIDAVEFLSGEEAVAAVMEDFQCARTEVGECVPSMNNDFYIRNTSTSTEVYNLTPESQITVFKNPGSPELEDIDLTTFLERAQNSQSLIVSSSPFMLIRDGMTITKLEQQYTP